jgi:hypothetical protein
MQEQAAVVRQYDVHGTEDAILQTVDCPFVHRARQYEHEHCWP